METLEAISKVLGVKVLYCYYCRRTAEVPYSLIILTNAAIQADLDGVHPQMVRSYSTGKEPEIWYTLELYRGSVAKQLTRIIDEKIFNRQRVS